MSRLKILSTCMLGTKTSSYACEEETTRGMMSCDLPRVDRRKRCRETFPQPNRGLASLIIGKWTGSAVKQRCTGYTTTLEERRWCMEAGIRSGSYTMKGLSDWPRSLALSKVSSMSSIYVHVDNNHAPSYWIRYNQGWSNIYPNLILGSARSNFTLYHYLRYLIVLWPLLSANSEPPATSDHTVLPLTNQSSLIDKPAYRAVHICTPNAR